MRRLDGGRVGRSVGLLVRSLVGWPPSTFLCRENEKEKFPLLCVLSIFQSKKWKETGGIDLHCFVFDFFLIESTTCCWLDLHFLKF